MQTADDLSLDTRMGWPPGLRTFLDLYPREVWPGHRNLGQTARFWLQRHDMFRDLGGALQAGMGEFREGRIQAPAFRGWFVPRLQFFLSELHGHHHIEDVHYFPVFRAAETRLVRGFDVLENDHAVIHEQIAGVVDAANGLLRSMESHPDAQRAGMDLYAGTSERLLKGLMRHLDDEEDLIVPVILDRGERQLFSA